MAKENLQDLLKWLSSDPKNRFEIYDVDANTTIEKCISYEEIIQNHGTFERFTNYHFERGVRAIQIVQKVKNGSTFVRKGCGLNFALSTDANNNVAAVSGQSESPAATQQHYQRQIAPAFTGLGNPGTMGLGYPEIMEMRSQADRYKETKDNYDELIKEVKELKIENRKLENENLKHQLGIESKPSAVDKLVEGIAANPDALSRIIQSFKSGTPGLNSPQIEANTKKLSDVKSYAVELISTSPKLTDEVVNGATHVMVQAQLNNEEFIDEFIALLQKHNL